MRSPERHPSMQSILDNVTDVSRFLHCFFTGLAAHYASLDQKGKVMAEYIWIDGDGEIRSKTTVSDRGLSLQK